MLALKGVSKSFGPVQALSDVDFEVQPGEVVALVGDNGAGKSTLVKTIAGIHPPDSGTISFEGKEVHDHRPERRRRSSGSRPSTRTSRCATTSTWWRTSSSGARRSPRGRPDSSRQLDEVDMEKQTGELLENLAVTITSVRAEVGTMSGGQRQQVAIARSLLGEPKLVMLDEPTAALGVRQTAMVLAADQDAARARVRRGGDQPQPRGRLRGGGQHLVLRLGQRRATSRRARPIRTRWSRRSPGHPRNGGGQQ